MDLVRAVAQFRAGVFQPVLTIAAKPKELLPSASTAFYRKLPSSAALGR